MKKIVFALVFLLIFSSVSYVQAELAPNTDPTASRRYVFSGYPVILNVPDNHTEPVAGARFASSLNPITVTDLNPASSFVIYACQGTNTIVTQTSNTTATVKQDPATNKYCFITEDTLVNISFDGDQYSGRVSYNTITRPSPNDEGFYNVRDFGAKGDGTTDDTKAILGAMSYAAMNNGGTIRFPHGDYIIDGGDNFKGLSLPSGIIIEGTGSTYTGAPTVTNMVVPRNASRISLRGTNKPLFRLGEAVERVVIRDIELYAQSNTGSTIGLEAVGGYNSTQDIFIERVAFNNFNRGIYARALNRNGGYNWQCDFWKINESVFVYSRDAALVVEVFNSTWALNGSKFWMPVKTEGIQSDGFRGVYVGMVTISNTYGGTPGYDYSAGRVGGDFLEFGEPGNVFVNNSQVEGASRSIVFYEPPFGNYSYPLTLTANIFGDPIVIGSRRVVTSMGNFYDADTWRNSHPGVMIHSLGDRSCYDGHILGCARSGAVPGWGGAQVVFDSGQPVDGSVAARAPVPAHSFANPVQTPVKQGSSGGPKTPPANSTAGDF